MPHVSSAKPDANAPFGTAGFQCWMDHRGGFEAALAGIAELKLTRARLLVTTSDDSLAHAFGVLR